MLRTGQSGAEGNAVAEEGWGGAGEGDALGLGRGRRKGVVESWEIKECGCRRLVFI